MNYIKLLVLSIIVFIVGGVVGVSVYKDGEIRAVLSEVKYSLTGAQNYDKGVKDFFSSLGETMHILDKKEFWYQIGAF